MDDTTDFNTIDPEIRAMAIEQIWHDIENPDNQGMRIDDTAATWKLRRLYKGDIKEDSWLTLHEVSRKNADGGYAAARANFFLLVLAAEGEL